MMFVVEWNTLILSDLCIEIWQQETVCKYFLFSCTPFHLIVNTLILYVHQVAILILRLYVISLCVLLKLCTALLMVNKST